MQGARGNAPLRRQGVKGVNSVRLAPQTPPHRAIPPYCSQNFLSHHRVQLASRNRYISSHRRRYSIADSCGIVLPLFVLHAAAAVTIVALTGRRQSRSRVATPPWSSRTCRGWRANARMRYSWGVSAYFWVVSLRTRRDTSVHVLKKKTMRRFRSFCSLSLSTELLGHFNDHLLNDLFQ